MNKEILINYAQIIEQFEHLSVFKGINDSYLVINTKTKRAHIIENNEHNRAVAEELIRLGAPVILETPPE